MSKTDTLPNVTQVLMLGLAGEIFAIEASMVREIIDPVPATRVASARPDVPSVINVRGNIIPLADIRVRFGMPQKPATDDTRFVVIELTLDDVPVMVGIVADQVHEVCEITRASIQPMPRVGMQWRPEFIRTIAKWNGEFVIVPDLQRIVA